MKDVINIYLMFDPPTTYFKIGKSYSPKTREYTLQAQAPQTTLVCYWEDCPSVTERTLHEGFKEVRVRGEWFQLNEAHLVWLYAYMAHWSRCDEISLPIEALQEFPYNPVWESVKTVTTEYIERVKTVTQTEIKEVVRDGTRSAWQIREKIDLTHRKEAIIKKAAMIDGLTLRYWEGYRSGLVWASGVDD